ncbi:uncharacterized protein BDZ99DRAFT_571556 [Mytilinidion resinicola]|uniref:SUZ domain-containing protein n=1 Tax=Mytilinidion resinicola TaxID=574789 RepID=A0A6A6YPA0_9PEZI|nr:uncharacterized protein BDZ99DRAFT_571556 [Mytilinidion resinicola]KAF2809805.1 hypothetical protein BDZ99DRAFT_571556 [Mytilinidion resinicola]
MASTAAVPVENVSVKPSFAKVAASTYKPIPNMKDSTPNAHRSPPSPKLHIQPTPMTGSGADAAHHLHNNDSARGPQETSCSTDSRTGQWANMTGKQVTSEPGSKDQDVEKPPPSIALVKSLETDDNTTQLSSSDGSVKLPSLDGKSVASATTFALDEKESIRPDDSASLRAVEEEDVISPPDSVATGSRVGSDSGVARAFRDQLHEISAIGPIPPRGAPPGRFQTPNVGGTHVLFDPAAPTDAARPVSQPLVNGAINAAQPPAIPDEKLIEALESPRDRLFVLKLEQDFIDFVKDSNESELSLPNCNTFYRMLTHRLADYYLLGHVVDDSMTAVKISKTSYCRIPPPLSALPVHSKIAATPPSDLPARKIMRRGGEKSGTNTNANSENPSKTTSEAGGGSSDGGDEGKDKSALTREEREARYKEARQRIFGAAEAEENESTAAAAGLNEETDISRSSSASGKKKGKKQRNYDDDGFEARSRFNVFYPQPYSPPAYTGDPAAAYYGQYPPVTMQTPQQFPTMGPTASPAAYTGAYPTMHQESQAQYGWPNQGFQSGNVPASYPNYTGAAPTGYDLSAEFQRGMSFQTSPMPSQVTPKMSVPTMASYQESYRQQTMPMNQQWPQAPQQHGFPMNPQFGQNNLNDRPMSASGQVPVPGAYPYGQFPNAGFNGGKNRSQHPLPGSFNRQQFNPQSQAFVPTHRNGSFPMQQQIMQSNMQQMQHQSTNGYGSYPVPVPMGNQIQMANQLPMMNQMQRPSPPSTQPVSFNAPRVPQSSNSTPSKPSGQGISHPLPQPVAMSASSQTTSTQSSNSSVPLQSSIAKWGVPSHLPPKPPPPAQPPKFALPGHGFAAVPRPVNNMPQSFPMNGSVSVRGGNGIAPSDGVNGRPA